MMFTAALVTIAKIYEQAECLANIPNTELKGDDRAVGKGLLGKNCQDATGGCRSPHYWLCQASLILQEKSKELFFLQIMFIKLGYSSTLAKDAGQIEGSGKLKVFLEQNLYC